MYIYIYIYIVVIYQHRNTCHVVTMNAQITCIDFETGWKNLAGSNGVYVRSANVTVRIHACAQFTRYQ